MICLITGSSRGLGRSIALTLGARGHKVAVHYKDDKTGAEEVASKINDHVIVRADVRSPEEVKASVEKVIEKWGRIDLLVNNAGITKESLLLKTSEEDFDEVIDTDLKGPFNFIRAAARYMMKQKGGHIINISSYAGLKGKEGLSAYSAAKAGLVGMTMSAAKELSRYNISVNAVLPGYMLTDMGGGSTGKGKEQALNESIIKEYSDPDSAAEFICYLAGTKGVTGQVFNLDSRIL
ncbi:3-oxoacyl-[acyl-carrier-protein] reductase FabG [bacterium BMS3Abin09]|nr:3-oxoacyl-[acyl-carrier-protein] reductase FabG [bacterium BMS3Abin09]GBE40617.1 3-oxoacyl-[acyl-carrier-protein] reductase FabG [bacterium BMS3Bbin09]HDH34900.1 SDR family NAD(P)-dependent oxidoreductase [Nitrospirota bacterium]HDO66943.1 SDR family NAD(P)-dependent oxidoreductase [Nitrospirota bacterium]HEW81117.1 SDR family NAD(P)-dependent oxidoreductase [Nitrospirota bacterium]